MKSLMGKDVAGMLGNVRVLAVIAAVALIALSFLAFLSCSRSKGGPASGLSYLDKNADFAGSRPKDGGSSNPIASRTLSIEEAIAEVKAYAPPADEAIDPQVFEMLRDELVRQIEARGIRAVGDADFWAKAVPEVVRFEESLDGSVDLVWIERNVGDYDANGEVGIPDITPIAQNYLAKPSEAATDEEREKLELIDGDRDDEIGVSDITPIAENYTRGIAGYDVLKPGEGGGKYIKLPNPNDPANENAISARRTEANESGENVERLDNALPPLYRYEIEPEHAPSSLGPMRSVSESGGRYYYVISPRESEDAPAPVIPNVALSTTMSPVAGAAPLTISVDVTVFGGTQPFTVTMLWESASIGDAEQFTGLMCDGTDPLITHTFEAPGEYYPQLTLTDSTGFAIGRSLGKVTVDDTLLPAPSGVTVEEGPIENSASVNWEPVANAKGYNVYFSLGISDKDPSLANMFPLETGPYTVTNLVPGFTYFFRVATLNANDAEGPMSAAYPYTNGETPEPPANVSASNGTRSDRIEISWDAVDDADSYHIYRSSSEGGDYVEVAGSPTGAEIIYDTSVEDYGTYWYKVTAANDHGESDLSASDDGYLRLDPPQGVTATDQAYEDKIVVSWTWPSGLAEPGGFKVYRATDESGANQVLLTDPYLPFGTTSYEDATVPDESVYWYGLSAVWNGLESELSTRDAGQTGTVIELPEAPANVVASQGDYADEIKISWESVPTATTYHIYRRTSPTGSYEKILSTSTTEDFDSTITTFNNYYYSVSAENVVGEGEMSSPHAIGYAYLAPPTGLTATKGDFADRITLNWGLQPEATGFHIYRSTSQFGSYLEVNESPVENNTFDDYIPSFDTFWYYVTAYNSIGESGSSDKDSGYAYLAPPTGLTATKGDFADQITLNWTFQPEATGFHVYRSIEENGSYTEVPLSPTGENTFDDINVPSHDTYWYYVTAYNSIGESGASTKDSGYITPNQAPTAALDAIPPSGEVPLTVTLDASGSSDIDGEIVNYEFDFDEGAGWQDYDADSEVEHTYNDVGTYNASVRVTDDDGATDTTSATISAYGWSITVVDSDGNVGYNSSLAVVAGKPAIAYYDNTNGSLKYVRAENADGTSWGTPITLDDNGNFYAGHWASLAVINGNPAVAYEEDLGSGNYDLTFIRASDSTGTNWNTPVVADANYPAQGGHMSLKLINENPAIAYSYWSNETKDLMYVRATNADGSSWGTPLVLDSEGDVGQYCSLKELYQGPGISYRDATNHVLKFIRSLDSNGSSWETPIGVDSTGNPGYYTSLAYIGGSPTISYYGATTGQVRYIRAANWEGDDWSEPYIELDELGIAGGATSLAMISNKPAVAYYDEENDDLKYVSATNSTGTSWNSPVTVDSTGSVGWDCSLCEVNDKPAISYRDTSNGNLKYAVYFPE